MGLSLVRTLVSVASSYEQRAAMSTNKQTIAIYNPDDTLIAVFYHDERDESPNNMDAALSFLRDYCSDMCLMQITNGTTWPPNKLPDPELR